MKTLLSEIAKELTGDQQKIAEAIEVTKDECSPGIGIALSGKCLAHDYVDHQCPVWIKVDKSSIHVCPLKEGCRLFRMLMKEEKEVL